VSTDTFCCVVCGLQTHADLNAAVNIARRAGDSALHLCKDRKAVKSLLMQRHEARRKQHGWPSDPPPAQFVRQRA